MTVRGVDSGNGGSSSGTAADESIPSSHVVCICCNRGADRRTVTSSFLPRLMKELVVNPGRVARRHGSTLAAYKRLSNALTAGRRRRLRALASTLPEPSAALRLPENVGVKVLPPGTLASAGPLI